MNYALLSPQPRRQFVNPLDVDAEPAQCAHLFAAKAEDEFTVGVATEGQSDIHETDVLATVLVGFTNGVPESDSIGVQCGIALTSRCRIP